MGCNVEVTLDYSENNILTIQVRIKLDEIDDKIILEEGTSTLHEMILVLKMVQHANKIAVAKGLSIPIKENIYQMSL
jgi:hypothetical protein